MGNPGSPCSSGLLQSLPVWAISDGRRRQVQRGEYHHLQTQRLFRKRLAGTPHQLRLHRKVRGKQSLISRVQGLGGLNHPLSFCGVSKALRESWFSAILLGVLRTVIKSLVSCHESDQKSETKRNISIAILTLVNKWHIFMRFFLRMELQWDWFIYNSS